MKTSMGRLCQNPLTLGSSVRCRYLANPRPTSAWSCDSAIFPVSGGQYGPVCGRIRAYQWGLQDAFNGRHRAGEHGTIYPCIPGIYTQDSLFVTRVTKPQKTTLYGNTHSWQLNKLSQHQQHQLCGYFTV